MPETIVDQLIVEGIFEPSGISRGIQQARAEIASLRDTFAGAFEIALPRVQFEQSVQAAQFASREIRQEFTLAADDIRRRFEEMLVGADLGIQGQRQATAAAEAIRNTFLNRLADLDVELAQGLISPQEVGDQARLAANAMRREFDALRANLGQFQLIPDIDLSGLQLEDEVLEELTALTSQVERQADEMVASIRDAAGLMERDLIRAFAPDAANNLRRNLPFAEMAALRREAGLALDGLLADLDAIAARVRSGEITPQVGGEQADLQLERFSQKYQAMIDRLEGTPFVVDADFSALEAESKRELDAAAERWTREFGPDGRIGRGRARAAAPAAVDVGPSTGDLTGLLNQIKQLENAERAGTLTHIEYTNGLARIRAEAIALREQGLVDTTREFNQFNQIMSATSGRVAEAGIAMRHMRLGAASMAVSMIGASGAAANLANGLLVFGGSAAGGSGSGLAIGVAAAVIAIAFAVDQFTHSADVAKERAKGFADQLSGSLDEVTPRVEILTRNLEAAEDILGRLQEQQRGAFERQQIPTGSGFGTAAIIQLIDIIRFRNLEKDILEQTENIEGGRILKLREQARIQSEMLSTIQSQRESLTEFGGSLAQVAAAGLPVANQAEQFAFHLSRALDISRDVTKSSEERLAALRTANDIIEAGLIPFERQAELVQIAGQEQLNNLRRLQGQAGTFAAPLGVDVGISESLEALEELAPKFRENAEEARRRAATMGRASQDIADRLRSEARAWDQLADQIDAALGDRIARAISNARTDVSNLVEDMGRLGATGQTLDIPLSIDDTAAIERLRQVQEFLQDSLDEQLVAGARPDDINVRFLQEQLRDVTNQINDALRAPVDALITNVGQIQGQLSAAQGMADVAQQVLSRQTGAEATIADQAKQLEDMKPIIDQLQVAYARVTAQIQSGTVPADQMVALLQTQLNLAQLLADTEPPTPLEVTQLAPLQKLANDYLIAKAEFDNAVASESESAADRAKDRMDAIADAMRTQAEEIAKTLDQTGVEGALLLRIVNAIAAAFGRAGVKADEISEGLLKAQEIAAGVADIANSIGRASDQMGIFNDSTREALGHIENMARATDQLMQGIINKNPFGIIAGGINLLGSIGGALGLGESPEEKARKAIERQNVEHLERIERELGNISFDFSGNIVEDLQNVFDKITDPDQFLLKDNTELGNRVSDLLESYGLSMQDVKDITEEMGFEFQNTAKFYEFFANEILPKAQESLTKFGDSLDQQRLRAELGARLRGEDAGLGGQEAAEAEFRRTLEVFAQFNPRLAEVLGNIGDEDAVRNALVNLFEQFEAGTLDLGDLTRDQFLEFLGLGADYLDSFNESLQEATRSTFNLPVGFKNLAYAFAASDPETRGTGVQAGGDTITRTAPPQTAEGQTPTGRELGDVFTQTIEKLELRIDGSGDPRKTAEAVMDIIRQLGLAQTGDTMQGLGLT